MKNHWLSLILLLSFALASCAPSRAEPLLSNPRATPPEDLSRTSAENPLPSSNTPIPKEIPSNTPPIIVGEPTESIKVTTVPSPAVEDEVQKKLIQLAIEDLATRLGINAEAISLMSAESTVWLDGALGCPTDRVYTAEKVPGFQIRLRANGQAYVYHTDRTGQVILCQAAKPYEPGLR